MSLLCKHNKPFLRETMSNLAVKRKYKTLYFHKMFILSLEIKTHTDFYALLCVILRPRNYPWNVNYSQWSVLYTYAGVNEEVKRKKNVEQG